MVGTKAMQSLDPSRYSKLKASDMAKKGSVIIDKLGGMVPLLAPYASIAVSALSIGGSVMSAFGFTRDSDEKTPNMIFHRDISNLARIDGSDPSEVAALMMGNRISIDPRLAGRGGEDELAFESLCSRFTLVHAVRWTPAMLSGVVLMDIPVTPFYCASVTGVNDLRLTTGGFCGLPFRFWRADMVYKFVIPVSKLHRGTLQFYWIPVGSSPTEDPTNTAINLIYDVVAGEDLEITIGYAREKPYLTTYLVTATTTITFPDTTNGYLRVVIVNPLLSQSAGASTSVNVFSMCKNVSFNVPKDNFYLENEEGVPVARDFQTQVVLQGALGDEEKGVQVREVKLVNGAPFIPSDALYFGETIKSARTLMQKFSGTYIIQTSAQVPMMLGPPSESDVGEGWGSNPWTWATWYASLFLGVAGSERFKFLSTGSDGTIGACRSNSFAPNKVSTMMPMSFLGPGTQNGTEYRIPYYFPEKFVLCRQYENDTTTSIFNGNGSPIAVWHAYADDVRVTNFRQVPMMRFRATPLTTTVREWGALH
jgi:hypothetical protein